MESNAFLLIRKNEGSDYSRKYYLRPSDDSGQINQPCGRDLSCMWAPQAMLPGTETLETPWGTVKKCCIFGVAWGHPSGGNWSCAAAPGIGPVAWYYNDMGGSFVGGLLADYHLKTVPATLSHTITGVAGIDTGAAVTWKNGTIAEVSVQVSGPSDAKWYGVSSYNPLTRSLRIYLADTASVPADTVSDEQGYDHLFTIEHLDPDSIYRFKLYQGILSTKMQGSLIYDIPLIADKVSTEVPVRISVPERGITVSGRIVTIRNGTPGIGLPLFCTLFSVDGRCIARNSIGEQQKKVTMIAPNAGVYVLQIKNGNVSSHTSRIVIAR